MEQRESMQRLCGAKARSGGRCRRPAGWGTVHKGRGPCRNHGGCLPNVVAHYERERVLDDVRVMGVEIDAHPMDGLLTAVRVTAGHLAFARQMTAGLGPDGEPIDPRDPWIRFEQEAVDRYRTTCKVALDAGTDERQIHIAERMAEVIAAAFEDALVDVDLPHAQRERVAQRFSAALTRLEGQPVEG